jgi:hypothetical protein
MGYVFHLIVRRLKEAMTRVMRFLDVIINEEKTIVFQIVEMIMEVMDIFAHLHVEK